MPRRTLFAGFVRNFIFGVEDSLVSTVGLLSGIAAAGAERKTILLTGTVLIFVEAFSMAVGSYLSEQSADEYLAGKEVSSGHSVAKGIIMFVSYFISGFVPLFPYLLLSEDSAFGISILCSLAALFVLGLVSAKAVGAKLLRGGIRMFFVGGLAILVGVIVGSLVQ